MWKMIPSSFEQVHPVRRFLSWTVLLLLAGCFGGNEPPFPGKAPLRAVYGTPPPTVAPAVWFRDVQKWGAEAYFYHSPHVLGNLYRQQAGLATPYPGDDLRQVAFLADTDPAFTPFADATERAYEEELVQEAYEACSAQGLGFYYSIPFPLFPVQDAAIVRQVHPELFRPDGSIDIAQPALASRLAQTVRAFKTAMPAMQGINLMFSEDDSGPFPLAQTDVLEVGRWLPGLLQSLQASCQELGIKAVVSVENIHHTNSSRREVLKIFQQFPDIILLEDATWPEETTQMPFWGFIPPQDSSLWQQQPMAVRIRTDTEFMGQGKIPVVLPRWWQYIARQAYLHEADIALCEAFQGDEGGTATNFNRINLHLLLGFLQEPNRAGKPDLQLANEEMFGDDFPTRLTAIMLIAEDAIQAVSGTNYINFLDHSRFPSPQFLDRDYLRPPYTYKAIDDLFEPPGTPLYVEDAPQPDTLHAGVHWRWQREISAQPVDQYLLDLENAAIWLDNIQKEVDYLTLDFAPEQRRMFVQGYRDLLLLGRGMYQFVQGAAVHHRWYRLHRMSREEALEQLAPIAAQLRLIAEEATGSELDLQYRLIQMARAFEQLEVTTSGD